VVAGLVRAWGPQGHALVAAVAEKRISTGTRAQIARILTDFPDIIKAASWPDVAKRSPEYAWSEEVHYADGPDWACTYVPAMCHNCVVEALANYSERIVHFKNDLTVQDEALKFIVHLVGDVHQPLHVGFGSDRGGNDITGHFFSKHGKLHGFWDSGIIVHRLDKDFPDGEPQYADFLTKELEGKYKSHVGEWEKESIPESFAVWASETAKLACDYAYTDSKGRHIQRGFSLGQEYFDRVAPVIDEQLAKAGVRLARLLDSLLDNDHRSALA